MTKEREMLNRIIDNGITLKSDFVFKKIFSENEKLLISLLKAILNINITKIEIVKDFALDKLTEDEKGGVLDIKATVDNNLIVNIEMQVAPVDMKNRSSYYASRLTSSSIKAGEEYEKLKDVICISILDYIMFKEEEATNFISDTVFNIRQTNLEGKEIFLREMEIGNKHVFIELPKFRKIAHDLDNELHKWLLMIDCKDYREMEKVMRTDEEFEKAVEELGLLINDERVMRAYDARQDAIRNEKYRLKKARTEGKEEGIEIGVERGIEIGRKEGEIKTKIEALKEMLSSELSIKQICKMLNISEEELETFKKSI